MGKGGAHVDDLVPWLLEKLLGSVTQPSLANSFRSVERLVHVDTIQRRWSLLRLSVLETAADDVRHDVYQSRFGTVRVSPKPRASGAEMDNIRQGVSLTDP